MYFREMQYLKLHNHWEKLFILCQTLSEIAKMYTRTQHGFSAFAALLDTSYPGVIYLLLLHVSWQAASPVICWYCVQQCICAGSPDELLYPDHGDGAGVLAGGGRGGCWGGVGGWGAVARSPVLVACRLALYTVGTLTATAHPHPALPHPPAW